MRCSQERRRRALPPTRGEPLLWRWDRTLQASHSSAWSISTSPIIVCLTSGGPTGKDTLWHDEIDQLTELADAQNQDVRRILAKEKQSASRMSLAGTTRKV